MKKIISILLLFFYLTTATELYQLFKLPILIEHFIEHKSKNQSISLFDFLKIHYTKGDIKDADYEKDMKLPFKSHVACFSSVYLTFANQPTYNFTYLQLILINKKAFGFFHSFINTSTIKGIWQPPQFC